MLGLDVHSGWLSNVLVFRSSSHVVGCFTRKDDVSGAEVAALSETFSSPLDDPGLAGFSDAFVH